MSWRIAAASVPGTSHLAAGSACQDSNLVQTSTDANGAAVLIACAADGAGSAVRGKAGADLACTAWIEAAGVSAQSGAELDKTWIQFVKTALAERSTADVALPSDYACTFLGAYLSETSAMFVQVGDGAIVVASHNVPGDYEVIFWPDQGEYANTTRFVTEPDLERNVRMIEYFVPIDAVALFTDGLQRLVLTYETKTAYKPFFESVFGHLGTENPYDSAASSKALAEFLASDGVNQRTDDDKTLVLAARV